MSDFRNISDFKKSKINKSSKTSQYPYQDPTYLSFVLLFDFNDRVNSPLLSGLAEEFLEKLSQNIKGSENIASYYNEKLIALREFKKALTTINTDMPWYWQSMTGLEVLQQWDPNNPYLGKDDAKLTIGTLESLNLPIAGLMHLYRKATFDERKWTWVLPENLRKFRMYVYVTEVRKIKNLTKPTLNGINTNTALKNFPDNIKPTVDIENANAAISGQTGRPYFMFALRYCEFDLTSGTTLFADLQKSPTDSASNEISIKYEALQSIDARVLNGIIEDMSPDKLSPAPDSENYSAETLGDFAKDKFNSKANELKDRAVQDLKLLGEQKKNELIQAARNATVNRIPSIDNIYQNVVQGIDGVTDVTQQTRNIGQNIQDNVFDITTANATSQTIGDALNQAAANSLGNVYD